MRTLILLIAVTACMREPAGRSDPPAEPTRPPAAAHPKETAVNPVDALLFGSSDSLFLAQVDKASAVFIGKLVEVGPPPTAFSGYHVATQALTYEVGRVLRGDVAGPRLTVHHVIVAQSPALVEGQPALRAEHTEVGASYLVALGGTVEGKRVTANENAAPVKATPDLIARVEAKLKP